MCKGYIAMDLSPESELLQHPQYSDSLRADFHFQQHLRRLVEAIYTHPHVPSFAYFSIPYRKIISDEIW
jgi:hypothetical protein